MPNECEDKSKINGLAENNDSVQELSRTQLQKSLKLWGLRSGGTTVALRERYALYHNCADTQNTHRSGDGNKSPHSSEKPSAVSNKERVTTTEVQTMSTVEIKKTKIKSNDKGTKETPTEKRIKRYRSFCPMSIQQRIDRAMTQRLFLIKRGEFDANEKGNGCSCDFHILGSTGNVYDVTIKKVASCSCPDHAKGNLCKHILFVLLKVMSLDPKSPLIYQAAWIESELIDMFEQMNQRYCQLGGTVLANQAVQESFAKLEKGIEEKDMSGVACKQIDQEDDCPICFDTLQKDSLTTVHCRARCGVNFHKKCIQHWLQQNRHDPTCPMCRAAWEDDTSKNSKTNSEGFSNLGKLQGQSSSRDMSSYSEYMRHYYKRRRY